MRAFLVVVIVVVATSVAWLGSDVAAMPLPAGGEIRRDLPPPLASYHPDPDADLPDGGFPEVGEVSSTGDHQPDYLRSVPRFQLEDGRYFPIHSLVERGGLTYLYGYPQNPGEAPPVLRVFQSVSTSGAAAPHNFPQLVAQYNAALRNQHMGAYLRYQHFMNHLFLRASMLQQQQEQQEQHPPSSRDVRLVDPTEAAVDAIPAAPATVMAPPHGPRTLARGICYPSCDSMMDERVALGMPMVPQHYLHRHSPSALGATGSVPLPAAPRPQQHQQREEQDKDVLEKPALETVESSGNLSWLESEDEEEEAVSDSDSDSVEQRNSSDFKESEMEVDNDTDDEEEEVDSEVGPQTTEDMVAYLKSSAPSLAEAQDPEIREDVPFEVEADSSLDRNSKPILNVNVVDKSGPPDIPWLARRKEEAGGRISPPVSLLREQLSQQKRQHWSSQIQQQPQSRQVEGIPDAWKFPVVTSAEDERPMEDMDFLVGASPEEETILAESLRKFRGRTAAELQNNRWATPKKVPLGTPVRKMGSGGLGLSSPTFYGTASLLGSSADSDALVMEPSLPGGFVPDEEHML